MMSAETEILDSATSVDTPAGLNRDLPLAVKALATFVMGADDAVLTDIAALAGLNVKEMRNFMRLNASDGVLASYGEPVRVGLIRWMDANKIALPASMRALAESLRGAEQDRGTPFFLNPDRIGEALPALPGGPRFVATYAGLWRIFRFSTHELGSEGRQAVSRAFLNIRPQNVLDRAGRPAPYFSMMFREGRNRPRVNYATPRGRAEHALAPFGKATGLVFPLGDRITFIGTRLSGVNPNPLTMIWIADETELSRPKGRADLAFGLAIMPNANGDQVASYTFAVRIDYEGNHSDPYEAYKIARDEELLHVRERYFMEKPEDKQNLQAAMGGETNFDMFMELNQKAGTLTIG